MQKYIALLRGINVGGNNKLPMKELKALLEKNGLVNVNTYIQTGNLVFESKDAKFDIAKIIKSEFGFAPDVMIMQPLHFLESIKNCPFKEDEGKLLHFYFCHSKPKANIEKLDELKIESESFDIVGKVFYLHAPDGIGKSKLAQRAEKFLGVSCTARNLNTVNKIAQMIDE